jgi:enolase
MDVAASEFFVDGKYDLNKWDKNAKTEQKLTSSELAKVYQVL